MTECATGKLEKTRKYFGVCVNKLNGIASQKARKLIINAVGILYPRKKDGLWKTGENRRTGEMVLRKYRPVPYFADFARCSCLQD